MSSKVNNKNKKVFVALSGGVDSSVAAALLKKRGWQLIGCHLRCFNVDGCGHRDAEDARRVAEQLNIPFYEFDLEEEYKERVVKYMIEGYRQGSTPNPDVMCNKEIKFGLFLQKALALGADYVATGHYVKKSQINDSYGKKFFILRAAKDANKDQSYFLWTLNQSQLKHCLFPLGNYTKTEVRKLAKEFGLITADKKDSQGICFLGKISLPNFLRQFIPSRKGAVLSEEGEVIGEHIGAQFYTIGQRHGFKIYHDKLKAKGNIQPFYVVEKDIKTNTIKVAAKNSPALRHLQVKLKSVNLLVEDKKRLNRRQPLLVQARVRYRQPLQTAALSLKSKKEALLTFQQPQEFIASGQSAVFYSNSGILLGGGVII